MSASRQFVDSTGFSWSAVEIVNDRLHGGSISHDRCLYFLSRGTTRKLKSYPAHWSALDWASLEDLCSTAEVVGADRGTSRARDVRQRSRALAR
jgi:hypothetical protein